MPLRRSGDRLGSRRAHMALPGDNVIIPVTPVGSTPQPEIQVTSIPPQLKTGRSGTRSFLENKLFLSYLSRASQLSDN
jgi:hypothetical protein